MTLAAISLDAVAASAAMTASQRAEMRLTGRPPSDTPVAVIERLTAITIPQGTPRAIAGHLSQGSLALLAVATARRTRPTPAGVAILGLALVASDAAVAVAVGLGPLPWRWTWQEALTDFTHKTALASASLYLSRRRHLR